MSDLNTAPRAPMKGTLTLTRQQEDRLIQEFENRRNLTLREMGHISKGRYDGWLGNRQESWCMYQNDFAFRAAGARFQALFKLFNSSCNVPKRAARMFLARANDSMLGIDPFVGLEPEGEEDADPAVKLAERFFGRKLNEARAKEVIREATEQAAVSGEAVIKIARKPCKKGPKRGRVWQAGGYDAVDEGTGKTIAVPVGDVRDSQGGPVHEHDEWEPDTVEVGKERLKRDSLVKKPQDARLSDDVRPLPQQMAWGELDIAVLPYHDFIISPNARTIEDADYCEHTMEWEEGYLRDFLSDTKRSPEVEQWLRTIHLGDKKPQVESAQPNPSQGGIPGLETGGIPKVLLAESWGRFDLNDDGEQIIELCLLWDVNNKFPVGYEYKEEMTCLQDERPFKCVRIIPSKNRWHGIGFYELLSNEHGFIDLQWNRITARSGTSGVFKWHRKGAIVELERGIPLELNTNRVYTIAQEVDDPSKAFGFTEMPALDENIWKMLMQAIQNSQTMSGTTQPSDSANSDLNQSNTLGEQELLSQESDVMNGYMMGDLLSGITDALKAACYVVFKNIKEQDANLMLGAENAKALLTWVSGAIEKLVYHLRLTMKKARNKQQMASNQQAYNILTGGAPYFTLARQDPEVAERARPMVEAILASNEIPDVDKILKPLTPLPPPALPANAPNSPGQPPAPALPAAIAA